MLKSIISNSKSIIGSGLTYTHNYNSHSIHTCTHIDAHIPIHAHIHYYKYMWYHSCYKYYMYTQYYKHIHTYILIRTLLFSTTYCKHFTIMELDKL